MHNEKKYFSKKQKGLTCSAITLLNLFKCSLRFCTNMKKLAVFSGNTSRPYFPKAYWKEVLAMLVLLLAIVFFRSERKELQAIIPHLRQSRPLWLAIAFLLAICNFFLQGSMYKKCFAATGPFLQIGHSIVLYLRRNLLSVFLPAGGVSALAYSPSQIRKAGFNKIQVHRASGLFGYAGLLSLFMVGLPVIIFTVITKSQFKNSWTGLLALFIIMTVLLSVARSIRQKGILYRWIDKKFPLFTPPINELFAGNVDVRKFSGAVMYSLGVELCGMLHVYIAMLALAAPASFAAAASAYIIGVMMMVVSPFLRGLGAVELSMVYILEQSGYSPVLALSITILYRIFEFWLPLVAGFISFAWKGRQIFFRLLPALLIFSLGLVNIISAATAPIHQRLRLLREYVPLTAIHASHLLVLFMGMSLLLTSAFLFQGLRNAWIIALVLSICSLIGHLTKALDYEEAIMALIVIVVLIFTTHQYRIRGSNKWMQAGVKTAGLSFVAAIIFGFTSFYFIDVKHFGVDFNWRQALVHTFNSFLLIEDTTLHPLTKFGNEFVWLIRMLGFITWGFLLFTLIKPDGRKYISKENYRDRAKFLLRQFGNSPVDYFKAYKDKLFFFSDIHEAFIAYRIAGGFAIVLEEPVCAEENKINVLEEFDSHCRKMGLKPAFYRVDENSIPYFNQIKKQRMMIGQEAILDIDSFSLEGKDKKSLRNGLSGLQKKGYNVYVHKAPHSPDFIFELKKVSDEWLASCCINECVFSQGMFDEKELQQQDILTLKDNTNVIKAFLNIIPDYAEDECTYDLIRKANDAPAAAMDAIIIGLIDYSKTLKKQYLNLGMVPMTGIGQPDNAAEKIIKLAAAKIKRFQHYKGLRAFKEKYATLWENKYLVYDNDFDLLQLPIALNKVMKP